MCADCKLYFAYMQDASITRQGLGLLVLITYQVPQLLGDMG